MAPGFLLLDRPDPSCCCLGRQALSWVWEAKSMDPGLSALQQPLNLTEDPCRMQKLEMIQGPSLRPTVMIFMLD